MKAEIISVGTEILLGDIVNTNAAYLSRELASIGVEVYHQSTVGDNPDRLYECFDEAFKRSDMVITTGGLGPTTDDLTKEVAAKYFDQELVLHEQSWEYIKNRMSTLGCAITSNNKKQSYFPKESTVIKNNNGTAPGAILTKNGKYIIILPGPPREMIPMFKESVEPFLEKFTEYKLISRTLWFYGIGESNLETKIIDIIRGQTNPTIALYAKNMEVSIRLTAKSKNEEEAKKIIMPVEKEIESRVGKYIYSRVDSKDHSGDNLVEVVTARLLTEKGLTISVAESCTGGMVSSTLIDYPGISKVFIDGCVTYSNESKIKRLGVKKETLEEYGAVSEKTAIEMARGVADGLGTDIGLSTTGIAGPQGGTKEKPVGLVYTAIYIKGQVFVEKHIYNGDRRKIREKATKDILNRLRIELLKL